MVWGEGFRVIQRYSGSYRDIEIGVQGLGFEDVRLKGWNRNLEVQYPWGLCLDCCQRDQQLDSSADPPVSCKVGLLRFGVSGYVYAYLS